VRTVVNDPEQSLDFWTAALGRQMEESGYLLLEEGAFSGAHGPGGYFEWLAPVGEEDWVYLTAITVVEEQIVIAEAAGRFDLYQARRPELLGALATLRVESGIGGR